jgi:hypothetical protein
MRKLLLTGFDENMVSETVLQNKRDYAALYGWDFVCKESRDFDKSRPQAFSKIPWIIDALSKYNLVFWNDFDSIFTNFTIDITDALGDEYMGMYEEKPSYFCAGNILLKSNEYTATFLKTMMVIPSWNNHNHPWEQRCLNEMAALSIFKHIKRFTKKEFGAFQIETGWAFEPWEKGDFMLHLCSRDCVGELPWEGRMKLFEEKYAKEIIYVPDSPDLSP